MIIRSRPSIWHLFFIVRGSVIQKVLPQVLFTVLLAILVRHFRVYISDFGLSLTLPPFGIIGLALSIFLGFKNSVAYERYWEARKLWGELLIASRSFARQLATFLPSDTGQKQMTLKVIAFTYALKFHLRKKAGQDASLPHLDTELALSLEKSSNRPEEILRSLGADLKNLLAKNLVHPQLLQSLDNSLNSFAHILGGCERIASTPIPFSYTLLLRRTAYLYCVLLPFGLMDTGRLAAPLIAGLVSYTFFGLEALGDEIEEPFGFEDNDLPLDALCRGIERDLLQGLQEASIPEAHPVVDYRLT